MALFEMKFQPGVDKQDTAVGATDRWIDSDNVRWRYNLPEKVGGWSSLLTDTIGNVYNRLVLFRGKVIPHGPNLSGFGDSIETGRLTQHFFFDEV